MHVVVAGPTVTDVANRVYLNSYSVSLRFPLVTSWCNMFVTGVFAFTVYWPYIHNAINVRYLSQTEYFQTAAAAVHVCARNKQYVKLV